ncbi:MAG: hypothetical protein HHJ13_09205 [Phycicoccus sp.]|nr:hypothetical protein [Phycicoccus sp.]
MMIVDCNTCPVRAHRCDDCVVSVLLAPGAVELPLDGAERTVVSMFVRAGMASADTAAGLCARHELMPPMSPMEHWGSANAVG